MAYTMRPLMVAPTLKDTYDVLRTIPSLSNYVLPNVFAAYPPCASLAARIAAARCGASGLLAKDRARIMDVSKLQEKKAALEEELQRTEENIYDLEGEYLQACSRAVTCHKPRQG